MNLVGMKSYKNFGMKTEIRKKKYYRLRKRNIKRLYKRVRWQKTLSWRLISILTATISAWIITGSVKVGLTIGGFDMIIKTLLYYFHERKWESVIKKNIKNIKEKHKPKQR